MRPRPLIAFCRKKPRHLADRLDCIAIGTTFGVIFANMNLLSKDKVNPLIGSAGVSAVPMAAGFPKVGQKENQATFY